MHDTEKNGGQQLLSPQAPRRAAVVQFTVILKSAVLGFDCENSSLELLVKFDTKFRYLEFRYNSNYLKMLVKGCRIIMQLHFV